MNYAKFGPAGTAESFKNLGFKKTIQLPTYLEKFSLDHFEYQCGQGVKILENSARELGSAFAEKNISISLHAPYFISLSSVEEEKRLKSADYILKSAETVDFLGGNRIVVHSGSCSKMSREEATALAKESLLYARKVLVENGLSHIHICPETMGKINQLGTLSEVLELCTVDESFIPCIDFGHLNARTFGEIKSKEDYKAILDEVENKLGFERLKTFHSHFSKIEYTLKGGEKKHLTFEDDVYGPDFEPLMELVYEKNLSPIFVCESAGTQTEDSQKMREYYRNLF